MKKMGMRTSLKYAHGLVTPFETPSISIIPYLKVLPGFGNKKVEALLDVVE